MAKTREFFGEVELDGLPLAAYQQSPSAIRDRYLLKDFLEYVHIRKGLLAPYDASYPLIEPRELLPSFEKNFAEYKHLPSFSMVAFNRPLSYQEEIFQFDLLYPQAEGTRRPGRANLDKIVPHLDRDLRPAVKQQFGSRDITDLAYYETFHDVRAAIAREKRIKGWSRAKRVALIESVNPRWEDLSDGWFDSEWRLGGKGAEEGNGAAPDRDRDSSLRSE